MVRCLSSITEKDLGRSPETETGQSTLEFTLTLLLIVTFFFFVYQLALVFGFASYAHYATFMSARAFLSAGENEQDQSERAENVMRAMIGANPSRYRSIAQGETGTGSSSIDGFDVGILYPADFAKNRANGWMQGTRYSFRARVFPTQLIPGLRGRGQKTELNLVSESFLGREPTASECNAQMTSNLNLMRHYDNGC